jgi:hypothetical protein
MVWRHHDHHHYLGVPETGRMFALFILVHYLEAFK